MSSHHFALTLHLLLFLLVYADSANRQQAHYYITPSLSVVCPGDPCLTLPQLAANSTSFLSNKTNITLSVLPGNHSLDGELSLSHADNFSITKANGTVFVKCGSQSGRFNISEITFVTIKDLHFVGCGGNKVSQVKQFIVEDTIFEGVEGRGRALVLNKVTDASIARSSFLSNTCGNRFFRYFITKFRYLDNLLNYLYLNRDPLFAVGGVVYTVFSNVSIVSSKFTDNGAEIGGALFAHNSSLHVVGSTYSYNKADFAGVMITLGSSINIKNSNFIGNTVMINGGVIIAYYSDSFSIHGTTFTNNSAGHSAGVMLIHDSTFGITDSIFSDNTAKGYGGVICANNGSFTITNSTFTNNSAGSDGVMITFNSSFIIISSTFTNNSATGSGGVMVLFDIASITFTINSAPNIGGVMTTHNSSFNITSSTFTINSAPIIGGVMSIHNSSFNITSSTFTNNSAGSGGVMITSVSSFIITSSTFINNSAADGGVMLTLNSSFNITSCTFINSAGSHSAIMHPFYLSFNITSSTFTNNSAPNIGGVMSIHNSSFNITSSTFTNNSAGSGGVMFISVSSFIITSSTFTNNSAADRGGVMLTLNSSFNITSCTFTNSAGSHGAIMHPFYSSFNITSSTFTNNTATLGGVIFTRNSSSSITSSTFTDNSADNRGGVMIILDSSFNITSSAFTNNSAADNGGVMYTGYNSSTSLSIASSTFINNSAANGGVIVSFMSSFNITSSTFTNNSAGDYGGVIYALASSLNIDGSSFYANTAISYGGIMLTIKSSTHITNGTFDHNTGGFYIFYSNLTFSGYTRLENCAEQSNETAGHGAREEGGAITSFLSTVIFTGVSSLSNNQARSGGAILATESEIIVYGETTIANNTAIVSSGGGISLQQSDLEVRRNCIISDNVAVRGGGIHATSSTIAVYQPGTLQFINNRAENGSGLYLEVNAKLYVLKHIQQRNVHYENLLILFKANHANYGGAIYVADNTNAGACSPDHECFVQILGLHKNFSSIFFFHDAVIHILEFSSNTASEQGTNIFGGLLDRCIPSPFAEVSWKLETPSYYSGVSYLEDITNNITATALGTISSLPVRICFCKSESEPDCSYQPPTIKTKKGEAFIVPLVAVDQVNHSVDANIISSLSFQDGGFSEGQQTQRVGKSCSNVTFNVFSPHNSERINLFADGPCGSSTLSTQHLNIQFSDCTCPVGFEAFTTNTRCQCFCDAQLYPHIINCDPVAESLVRVNTNSWITHINDTHPPGYIIHPNCPLDYCRPPTENVSMNLNLPDGSDAQCAYNRTGVLCGGCQEYLSLSLGSSRCLSCHSHWPAVLVVILLAAIVAGILLVTALLALNMTVAIGLINGFIFYANIVTANSAIFFPSSEPSFPTVFVAWLNLDIGIDVCFFDGLDTYTKSWLQLAFPVYIISLVIIVIIVSEYSPRFVRLIGKRDPIATLATLILLSYAKLLSVTITALSFAILDYPDGSQETVWLPDGNVPYLRGKHVALVLVALLIILVGVPYTILLFLWQWIIRAPQWKVFNWTRNTKLNAFISVHHAPYNSKYRYWTGFLLLMRVVLYITASVTVSGDPQTSLLVTIILVGSLFLINGARVYKKSFLNIIETGLYFNLLALSAFSFYHFKIDIEKQTAVAYTSTIIIFILLAGVIIYHVYLLVRKDQPQRGDLEELNEYLLAPVQPVTNNILTHTSVEIPRDQDQSPPPALAEISIDRIVVREIINTETPVYTQ